MYNKTNKSIRNTELLGFRQQVAYASKTIACISSTQTPDYKLLEIKKIEVYKRKNNILDQS